MKVLKNWLSHYDTLHNSYDFLGFIHLLSNIVLVMLILGQIITWTTTPTLIRASLLAFFISLSIPYLYVLKEKL